MDRWASREMCIRTHNVGRPVIECFSIRLRQFMTHFLSLLLCTFQNAMATTVPLSSAQIQFTQLSTQSQKRTIRMPRRHSSTQRDRWNKRKIWKTKILCARHRESVCECCARECWLRAPFAMRAQNPTNFVISLALPRTNCFINRNSNSICYFIIFNFSLVSWISRQPHAKTLWHTVVRRPSMFNAQCSPFAIFLSFQMSGIYCIVASTAKLCPRFSYQGTRWAPINGVRESHTEKCQAAAAAAAASD